LPSSDSSGCDHTGRVRCPRALARGARLTHVNAVTVLVLLIHGKDDTVVPFEQSQLMHDALKGANKDVQLVKLKDEDH
jgi:dipeptidyl aminopeptidase/acylaminoacyl peptidase